MKKRIRTLIISSILGLIALSIIQGYLINNTYQLKKKAFISETRSSISRIDDFSPQLDSINDIWQEHFLKLLADYRKNKIAKEDIMPSLTAKTDSLKEDYKERYKKELDKNKNPYNLKFQKRIRTIVILDSIQNDTIFYSSAKKDLKYLIGDEFSVQEAQKVSNSLWLTEFTYDDEENGKTVSKEYDLHFETEDYMNIAGWKRIVLFRMSGLLIISVSIFLIVFGLLYYSIKNLITQKKIADIKTDFVNNITHELKTPLATLTLATKMLQKDEAIKQSSIADVTVNTIERQNKRLQKLIDQVLNNSLGYHEIQLKKESINANDYLNMILDDFQLSVNDKDVKVERSLKTGKKQISVDKFFLTTALFNILENAVKYSKENILIHFSSEMNSNLRISIEDQGIGIVTKDQKLLFDKFFRAGDKEIHNVKGLGLGLYYTNQIVKAHGGQIQVKSTVGKGTSFVIEIPIA